MREQSSNREVYESQIAKITPQANYHDLDSQDDAHTRTLLSHSY
ncbi:hypothetical protein T01_6029 [Trichinella spiralis]|uniref:Uncharacterized protein n=1 Tax=Trichinella spiralis TaxID=6334 RepID=A0A0V1APR6_TRISP|nr:hypothetical protein T01_6029 [Trichinella spiralis]